MNCKTALAVVLILVEASMSSAQTATGDRAPPARPTSGPDAAQVTAGFVASDFAVPGYRLPLVLRVVNGSSTALGNLCLRTNQGFRYEVAAAIPAGQVRKVSLAPWYFDGRFTFSRAGEDEASGEAVSLMPRPLPADTALVLFDPGDVDPDRLTDHLMHLVLHYFPAGERSEPSGSIRPQPVSLGDVTVASLKDSVVSGLVVSDASPRLGELRRVAVGAGLDLWTVGADGPPALVETVPGLLRRLARRTHVRDDLFDLSSADTAARIPDRLFRVHVPRWSAADRVRLTVPLMVGSVVLVCLALLGARWPRPVNVSCIVLVVTAVSVWTLVTIRRMQFSVVDTVTVTVCDAASGRAYTEDLASVTWLRRSALSLRFEAGGGGPPRALMPADTDRKVYEDILLRRDLEGRWSVGPLEMEPGLALGFGMSRWEAAGFAPGDVRLILQSEGPEVRLKTRRPLADAYVYLGDRAWPVAEGSADGVYRPVGHWSTVDGAAYAVAAPEDGFRRRAMRWVGRHVMERGVGVFFGWDDAPAAVTPAGARRRDHGRLLVWLVRL